MKKIMFVAACLLSSIASMAQKSAGSISFQPKVGVNMASFTEADNLDPRWGLAAGAELEYQLTDMVSVAAGALYSQQGAKGEVFGITGTTKLDYVNVPVVANVYVLPGFAVKLGIQPGFLVSSKQKLEAGKLEGERSVDGYTKVDWSLPIGVSYEFNKLVLDGRYNFGLNKVLDGSKQANSVFQLTLGYKF